MTKNSTTITKAGISVIHSVASLHPSTGGPAHTVTHLTDALAAIPGSEVSLFFQGNIGATTVPSSQPSVTRFELTSASQLALKLGLPLRQALHKQLRMTPPAILHDHGLWLPCNHWVANESRSCGIPLIIQPRGTVSRWALNQRAFNKKIAMHLYQWRNLKTAQVLVATAISEYEDLRMLGLRQPIAVIPNGVHVPKGTVQQRTTQQRTVLFLSRIHKKKGLLNLIDAWAQIHPDGWRLQIAGPDEDSHLAEVLARAKKWGVTDSVDYLGVVDGVTKSQLYGSADLFVLPTLSENFGVVIAEALAHGLPVITTRGAPWQDLKTYRCGWWIDIGIDPLKSALREAMALSDTERRDMGSRGLDYVRRYDWCDIALQTADVYRWVLGLGSRPACIQLD